MGRINRRQALQGIGASLGLAAASRAATGKRPNIVMIVVDDMRFDEFGAAGHPWLETPNIDRLAREGAMFTEAIHAIPLCSPNRASILTGQYPSRHGVAGNEARSELSHRLQTFPRALQRSGYRTGFVGKWHMGNDATPRPGFDYWVSFPGQGAIIDPQLHENGRLTTVPGYITDLLTDRSLAFLHAAAAGSQPFFLYLGHKAIHPDAVQHNDGSIDPNVPSRFIPAPRHDGRYAGKAVPRRPNFVPPDQLPDNNAQVAALLARKYAAGTRARYKAEIDASSSDATVRGRAEMLLSIDEGLGRILRQLEADGVLENTVILFTSDNGYFHGEHGLSVERRLPFEEAVKAPLLVRAPGLARPGSRIDALVSSVDLAPTVLELAGAPIGPHIQGRSFAATLSGAARGRDQVYIEYGGDAVFDWLDDAGYRAIRTRQHKYVHWIQHPERDALYDLASDPFEQRNRIGDPALAPLLADLKARLRAAVADAVGL
ncbi:hypothetical protein CHU93_13855 [Sandarakinorhabdus cyanobacteriorum]|uniref:Sulfatase N-terminal domain-containing protein n=1 Tax=Sandarakinorhabdus cyanobacteriorum TaxID=1981098 RepID=A0A255Y9M5_9SPHN|nr:sulfatase-like hydrolase/transferase [Sandarakinorhabdus cyanobacteriorum]OYQ25335.1 hypothetical protein CHU93_13855 [Sandarakinorhabdus cyanobacteriorum]